MKLDLDVVDNQAGVFPFAAADIEPQALDRQQAVEYLDCAFLAVLDRDHDIGRFSLDLLAAGDAVGAGAGGLDLARDE